LARSDAKPDVGQADGELLTAGNQRVEGNRGRKNTREKRV